MRKLILTALVASVVTAFVTMVVVRHLDEETVVDSHVVTAVVRSGILNEQRDLIVSLPDSYEREPARRYPVLYVLDGSSHTTPTAESARLLARIGVMPEVIVVGLPSSSENRARDYTPPYMRASDEKNDGKDGSAGEADRFLQFIEKDLIPAIEQRYRATSTRMLAGHSRGGLFVVYSLIERPGLFSARFAFSPALWRDDHRIVRELARSLKARDRTTDFLYLSLGDRENEKMTRAFRKAVEILRAPAPPGFRLRVDLTRGAGHSENAALSTPVALCEYFRRP